MAALAAEAAEDAPRASMIAAPRLATVGMKVSASHTSSLTTSAAFLPAISAWKMSGYWVAEWLPQIVSFLMSETAAPVLAASCEIARLWSRRVIAVKRSAGTSGAAARAISALVLAGLPTTRTLMSSAAWSLMALPCGLKMPPLPRAGRRAPCPWCAGGRRPAGRRSHRRSRRSVVGDLDAAQQREGAVVELHGGALGGLEALRDLQEAQVDRHVRAEQVAGGDAEEQRVADLAGCAGHGDIHGSAGHGGLR